MKRGKGLGLGFIGLLWAAGCALPDYQPPPVGGGAGGAGGVTTDTSASASIGASTGGQGGSCTSDADCPKGADVDCTSGRCNNGECSVSEIDDNVDRKPSAQGDCKDHVCQNGVLTEKVNDGDVPSDGNTCTMDVCDNGVPSNPPFIDAPKCPLSAKFCALPANGDALVCSQCNEGAGCLPEVPCIYGKCYPALNCKDGQIDLDETGVDCGGSMCAPCIAGVACKSGTDCTSGVCAGDLCAEPACDDAKKNGAETDVDCGGDCPNACISGQHCQVAPDCRSGVCYGGFCIASKCDDNVANGEEIGVDCGGSCPPCAGP